MTPLELTGRARTHVVPADGGALHVHTVVAFDNLCAAARADGLALTPVSSFRDFERQLAIWNGKFLGTKPLFDAVGAPVDALRLSPAARIDAILVWSALPGASRHHWGTDVDVIDANASSPAGDPLTVEKFAPGGPYAPLSRWLKLRAAHFGFFRPYLGILSGVHAEPWHLSFAPLAAPARRALTPALLRAAIEGSPMEGKVEVLRQLEALHRRYVMAIDWP